MGPSLFRGEALIPGCTVGKKKPIEEVRLFGIIWETMEPIIHVKCTRTVSHITYFNIIEE